MFNLEKLRLPYREDNVFGLLALVVFVVPLAFFLLTNENFETAKFSLMLILVGCALVAFLNRQPRGRLAWKSNKVFFYLLAAFFIWAIISTIFSADVIYSVFGFYYRFTDGLVFYSAFIAFIVLLVNTLDRAKLIFLLKILVVDALAVSVVACLQALNITYYAGGTATGLVQGPSLLGNPDFSAMFLAVILPLALVFLVEAKIFFARIYYGLCAFAIVLASLVFASRGALLAICVSLIFALAGLLIFHFPKKLFFSLLALMVAGAAFGGYVLKVTRPAALATIVQSVDSNTTARLAAWQVSLGGILRHPFLGSGLGTYALFFEQNRPPSAAQVGVFDDPHNLFLRMAVTGGLPFMVIFGGLLALVCYYAVREFGPEKDLLLFGSLLSLVAWCVGVSFNPVPIPMFMLLALLLAALLLGHTQDKNLRLSLKVKWSVYIFAAVLIIFGLSLAASEFVFGFAKRAYLNQDYRSSFRLSAVAQRINPTNQLYELYRIGSEIGLKVAPRQITVDINRFARVHKNRAANYVEAGNMYSLLYESTGDKIYLESAAGQMNKALDIDKLYGARYGQLALYYYQLGDLDGAKTAVEKSIGLEEDQFPSWVLLAKIYELKGQKAQTIFALTKAFKLNPDIPLLKYLLYLAKTQADIRRVGIPVVPRKTTLE